MTHNLHRAGTPESLADDFVLLFMTAHGFNDEGSAAQLKRCLEVCIENGAIKIGDAKTGAHLTGNTTPAQVVAALEDRSVPHGVFDDSAKLVAALKQLKTEDIGMSAIVSGLKNKVVQCCKEAELTPHTINESLGRWGRVELLPDDDVLALHTMCGHGMITVSLIEEVAAQVKAGKLTPEEGAEKLYRPCGCGVFNTHRAADLLRAMCA